MHLPFLNRIHGAFMMLIVERSARFRAVLYLCPTGGHDQLAYQPRVAELPNINASALTCSMALL
jgi:hypothetical protein